MKNLISYDDFVNESASNSEWKISRNLSGGGGLLEVIPENLQVVARKFLKSLATTPTEKMLVADTLRKHDKYGPTINIEGPIVGAILPIYTCYGDLRAGNRDSRSQAAYDAFIEALKSFGK